MASTFQSTQVIYSHAKHAAISLCSFIHILQPSFQGTLLVNLAEGGGSPRKEGFRETGGGVVRHPARVGSRISLTVECWDVALL